MGAWGKVDTIKIRQGSENRLNFVAMDLAELDDFLVGKAIGDLCCALIMAEKGHIGQGCLDAGVKTAHRKRNPTPLAASADGDTLRIDGGMCSGCFDGTYGVGENAAIIIGMRIENAARHKAGDLRIGPVRLAIGCIAPAPGATLTACIHNKMRKAGAAPGKPFERKTSSTAITDVLDYAGQGRVPLSREQEPAFNRLPGIAIEGHIKTFNGTQTIIRRDKASIKGILADGVQCLLPESIKILRLVT